MLFLGPVYVCVGMSPDKMVYVFNEEVGLKNCPC